MKFYSFGENKTFYKSTFFNGFTLVEVIIVIGIIGLLSGIIYTSFDGAKAKGRDQQRVADISTIQLALEIYFNKNRQYPDSLSKLEEDGTFSIPNPPNNRDGYGYYYFPIKKDLGTPALNESNNRCISYHLWTTLEVQSGYLESKSGFNSTELPTETGRALLECGENGDAPVDGTSALIYDVKS
jgi:prepilin-type N-terminal cleavage/methylation domain-containing protein